MAFHNVVSLHSELEMWTVYPCAPAQPCHCIMQLICSIFCGDSKSNLLQKIYFQNLFLAIFTKLNDVFTCGYEPVTDRYKQ